MNGNEGAGMDFWRDKVVLVTGASRGIGRALTDELAHFGARLVLTARGENELELTASRISAIGAECVFMTADVQDEAAVQQVVRYGVERLGRLDVLINNAGVGLRGQVDTLEPALLMEALAVNVIGPLNFIRAATPLFKEQRTGLIINIASLGAIQAAPNIGGYAATKAALAKLGEALHLELEENGIRVCTAYPGSARTEFRNHALGTAYRGHEPRLSRIAPELVAKQILQQAAQGKREIYVTRKDRCFAYLARIAPRFADFLVGRAFRQTKGI